MTLAIITGGSTGIGLELARIARAEGHQAIIVADEPAVHTAAAELGAEAVEAALAGRYPNSVTTLGLMWLASRREWLREHWGTP